MCVGRCDAERGSAGAGADARELLDEATRSAVRAFAVQRASAVLRLHHVESRRQSGRSAICSPPRSNQNVGRVEVSSPMATEIEAQTVRWIAELIGYPADCGGLLVSGGNMANFVCFLAARTAKAGVGTSRKTGLRSRARRSCACYASTETHTWIQKAADLSGLGTDAIRWIPVDDDQRMDTAALERQIEEDRQSGELPVPGRRHGRLGQHRRRRSAAGDSPPSAANTMSGFTSMAPMARWRRGCPARPRICAALARRRFGGGRSAQVAVRAARGRLRAGAPARRSAATRFRIIRPTTTSTGGRSITSTTVRRTRAASAR